MSVSEEEWLEVQRALGTLITARTRADGKSWQDAFENMPVYLERLGLQDLISNLKVLHVAGTKGKGSTCAFTSSILTACGYRVGLFTSPHLCDVRERIQINGTMVAKSVFAAAFWECFHRLKATADDAVGMPAYFRFLTLLALKIFAEQRLDVVVLEVGIGGRLDATNIIPRPVATAVTTLDLDHVELLGDTLAKIAQEKAGIFRAGVPAITCAQDAEAMASLERCAQRVRCFPRTCSRRV